MKPKQPPGEPMTLGNMHHLGVRCLVAHCLNPSCRHEGLIDVAKYVDDVEVPTFGKKVVCSKCGARGRHNDVRPRGSVESFSILEPKSGICARLRAG
jgi:hypothetical protein